MKNTRHKEFQRNRRHKRILKKIKGHPSRKRLVVRRSLKHIYAHIVDDETGKILVTASTLSKEFKGKTDAKTKTEMAKEVGLLLAQKCKTANVEYVVFDRSGYKYHGRVKALAEGAREGGLKF
ncbi:MAG: 50S ribosomal protein L18 [Candidatus Cloacimonas sp. 4484_209]|nr:MAG: 50S ribosomal protein L18 [Candidatus Cloacimonas sp. 4484_209]